jgi:hypothetical protein
MEMTGYESLKKLKLKWEDYNNNIKSDNLDEINREKEKEIDVDDISQYDGCDTQGFDSHKKYMKRKNMKV